MALLLKFKSSELLITGPKLCKFWPIINDYRNPAEHLLTSSPAHRNVKHLIAVHSWSVLEVREMLTFALKAKTIRRHAAISAPIDFKRPAKLGGESDKNYLYNLIDGQNLFQSSPRSVTHLRQCALVSSLSGFRLSKGNGKVHRVSQNKSADNLTLNKRRCNRVVKFLISMRCMNSKKTQQSPDQLNCLLTRHCSFAIAFKFRSFNIQ